MSINKKKRLNGNHAKENFKAATGPSQSGSQHSSLNINWGSSDMYADRPK